MIELIKIKNYALIEDSEIDLSKGLNIITGETGAGKSLFINALNIIIGEKVSSSIIGKNGTEAVIEAIIKINKNLKSKLAKHNIDHDDQLVVKRVIGEKNKCYVNGNVISLNQLKDIMGDFLNFCSQHENQKLLESDYQLDLLDGSIGLDKEKEEFSEFFNKLGKLKSDKEIKSKEIKDSLLQKDFISFQIEEIKSLKITKEDESLEEKIETFKSQSKTQALHKQITENINGELGIKSLTKETLLLLKEMGYTDTAGIESSYQSLATELNKIPKSTIIIDDEEIDYLLKRKEDLYKVLRKYGSVDGILEELKKLEDKLLQIEDPEAFMKDIESEIKSTESKLKKIGSVLSKKRADGAIKLSSQIQDHLKNLNMPYVQFEIKLDNCEMYNQGFEKINFYISPNKSEELKKIKEIASGGELSRIVLSIYSTISGSNDVFLFDEVDAGIGGNTAPTIGRKLKDISKKAQVICITHLPQVAVFGESNHKIEKIQSKNKTVSHISQIKDKDLEQEIARMLGSSLTGTKALENAREMIKSVKK